MGEIVQVQVGQFGNRVGARFLQSLCAEHGLNDSGYSVSDDPERTYGRKVFFDETKGGQYSPRALLVDMEPSALDTIRAGPCGRLFTPDQYVFDTCGTGNLFVRGFYTVGQEFSETVLDGIRRLTEATDRVQALQFVYSLGGGTGSGLGSLLISRMKDYDWHRVFCVYPLFPSRRESDSVLEVYNTVLSIHQLVENCEIVTMFDNETLFNLAHRKQSIESPTFSDLNHLISDSMVHVTSPSRFHGIHNSNLRKMAVDLVPFPRLHFFNVIQAPLSTREGKSEVVSVPEMIEALFDFNNSMSCTKIRPRVVPYGFTGSAVFRGQVSSYEVEHGLAKAAIPSRMFFRSWIPNPLSSCICSVPAVDRPVSASFLFSSNFSIDAMASIHTKFTAMLQRKAFLHWYASEGMEEMEFTEAGLNIRDLTSEYAQFAACGAEDDFEEMEEE